MDLGFVPNLPIDYRIGVLDEITMTGLECIHNTMMNIHSEKKVRRFLGRLDKYRQYIVQIEISKIRQRILRRSRRRMSSLDRDV